MSKKAKKLVVVADDFGWTKAISDGIVKSYKEGITNEVSLILNYPASDYATNLVRQEKLENIGIHMVLIGYKSIGRLYKREDYIKLFTSKTDKEIERLALNELVLFKKLVGKNPTHIVPHYGIHGNLKLLTILIKYAKENGLAIRIPKTALKGDFGENYAAEILLKRSRVTSTDHLFAHVLGDDIKQIKEAFINDLKTVKDSESAEIMFHPGYFDAEILKYSSLGYERARDLALSLDEDFRKRISQMSFKIVSYSKL